jgi:hypothetical protein
MKRGENFEAKLWLVQFTRGIHEAPKISLVLVRGSFKLEQRKKPVPDRPSDLVGGAALSRSG